MIRIGSPEDHGLSLDVIQIDGGTQSRATLNQHVVNEYAEAIKAGATFPPIVVFYDGKKHWLADGFHRFHAYQKAGKSKVAADVRQGTRRDAILHSVGANETHGLRRTRDDKRRAVLTLLNDPEWSKWSDREIARRCAVSDKTVASLRPVTAEIRSEDRTYTTKHGTSATMKTAGINASRKQFQAKASEDNGSITGGAGAVTGEASRPASGRTDAGEATSVDLPTASRNIVAEILALWNEANETEREEVLATISPSASTHAEAVADKPQPPRPSATAKPLTPDPQYSGGVTAVPATQAPQLPAQNDDVPHVVGQGGQEPAAHHGHAVQEPAGDPQGRNEPASGEPASVDNSHRWSKLRPHCLSPDCCAGVGAKHCHRCTKAMAESGVAA